MSNENVGDDLFAEVKEAAVAEAKKAVALEIKDFRNYAVAKSGQDDWDRHEWFKCIYCTSNGTPSDLREKAHNTLRNKYANTIGEPDNTVSLKTLNYSTKSTATYSQGTASAGGYTVPNIWHPDLLKLDPYDTVLYDRVRRYDAPNSLTQYFSRFSYSGTGGVSGQDPFAAGSTIQIVAEGAAPSNPTSSVFSQLALTPSKILATSYLTRELIDNSIINMMATVQNLYRQMIKNVVEYNLIQGAQTNYVGIVNDPSNVKIARSVANQINFTDVTQMRSRLVGNGIWLVGPTGFNALMTLQDSTGHYLWLPSYNNVSTSAAGAPPITLLGLPVFISQFMPALGSAGDILLLNPDEAITMTINQGLTLAVSDQFLFNQDLIALRGTMRFACKPTYDAPVTLQDNSTQVGASVILKATTS
jgi:HK97 family phage major capsid protein